MSKIIFLDYDGVLNNPYYLANKGRYLDGIEGDFDPKRVEWLAEICDRSGAGVVVTSSWKHDGVAIEYLRSHGIKVVGAIGDDCRGEEIDLWLENHDVDKYLILDDDSSEFSPEQMKHLIYTREGDSGGVVDFRMFDCCMGLQEKHIGWAIMMLGEKEKC